MKPSEKTVLDALRSTTLAYLSKADFTEVEKAVERDGILNVTGSVRKLLEVAVQKHGSHNQASHGRKGGGRKGGGGGSGGTGVTAKQKKDFKAVARDKGIAEGQKQVDFQEDFLSKNPDSDLARARLEGVKEVAGKSPEETFSAAVDMQTKATQSSNKLIENANSGNENSQIALDEDNFLQQKAAGASNYIETRFGEKAAQVTVRAGYENGKAIGTIWDGKS
jgi:hypothetical protein